MFRIPRKRFPIDNRRVYALRNLLFSGFLFILISMLLLQIPMGYFFRRKAEGQRREVLVLPARRGTIFDRKGRVLAADIEVVDVEAYPRWMKEEDKEKAARVLSSILGIEKGRILRKLGRGSKFVLIARDVELKAGLELEKMVRDGRLRQVRVRSRWKRVYPCGPAAAHVVGACGSDGKGLEGIERSYEWYLSGRPGKALLGMEGGRRERPEKMKVLEEPKDGKDLYLTIDVEIQAKLYKELEERVRGMMAKGGAAVAVDPNTGEVLAMASVPSYDPNRIGRSKPDQRRNRAVQDAYEPGSTFKMVVAAAGLNEGIFSESDIIRCPQAYVLVGSHRVRDVRGHGFNRRPSMSVRDIIVESSNVGATILGRMIGPSLLFDYIRRFGFGSKTGIELFGETAGIVRKPKGGRPEDVGTVPFGQGIATSLLQIAMATSVIANGGILMKPTLVKAMEVGGKMVEAQPTPIRHVLLPQTCSRMGRILKGVVDEGTGKMASVSGYDVAGKTGTAQKVDPLTGRFSSSKHTAFFTGYAPTSSPKVVMSILIDEPRISYWGGVVCAPVFRNAMEDALLISGCYPKGSDMPPKNTVRKEGAEAVPDLFGMEVGSARRLLLSKGFRVEGVGVGNWVISQDPGPGRLVLRGSKVVLRAGDLKGRMPSLKGLPLRKAVSLLRSIGITSISIHGDSGPVVNQDPAPRAWIEKPYRIKASIYCGLR